MDDDIKQMVEVLTRGALEMRHDANWAQRYASILAFVVCALDADRDKALDGLSDATSILAGSFGLNLLPKWTQQAVHIMDDIQAEDAEILAEIREEHAGEPWLEYLDD